MAGIFKGLHSAERLCKDAFLVTIFTEDLWAISQTGEKKSVFSNKIMDMCVRALSCYMYVSGGVNYQNFVLYEIELRKVSLPWWTVKELKVDVSRTSLSF